MESFELFLMIYCYTGLALIVIIPLVALMFGYLDYKFEYKTEENDENTSE